MPKTVKAIPEREGRRTPSEHGGLVSIQRVDRADEVRKQLLGAIERGDFSPGERLPSERDLATTLGVSRVSVREAMRSLEALGFIDVQHGRGSFVAEAPSEGYANSFSQWLALHHEEVLELLNVRGALDALAAGDAASKGAPVEELRSLNEQFRRAAAGGDADEIVACDERFHHAIAGASGSPLLVGLLAELHTRLVPSRHIALAPKGRAERSARDHDRIIAAIAAGDDRAARAAVAKHIKSVRDAVVEHRAADQLGDADTAR